jgi:RNA polymerase sigma-70 factor (ECF subfamily)
MVGDATEAEDLTQEAFLLLFRKIQTFRGESAFSTWLHRLAVNVVLMRLRKRTLPAVSLNTTPDPNDETGSRGIDIAAPDLSLEGSIDRINLERCMAQLPLGYRTIFVLHDIQGYKHQEIAEMLGRSEGVSKSQLHRAHMRLRELLHEIQREKSREERLTTHRALCQKRGPSSILMERQAADRECSERREEFFAHPLNQLLPGDSHRRKDLVSAAHAGITTIGEPTGRRSDLSVNSPSPGNFFFDRAVRYLREDATELLSRPPSTLTKEHQEDNPPWETGTFRLHF